MAKFQHVRMVVDFEDTEILIFVIESLYAYKTFYKTALACSMFIRGPGRLY